MLISRKTAALTLGAVCALAAATIAQTGAPRVPDGPRASGDTLVVQDGLIEWILKSDVSALADGVLEKVELDVGKFADKEGAVIGTLYRKRAELVVKKAELAAANVAAEAKGKAEFRRASAVVARNNVLTQRDPTAVSREEQEKAKAEMEISVALIAEAKENQSLAKAELELAKQQLEEHTIRAPFPGQVYERLKNPGESVRAGDAIVRLGSLDKLRVVAFIPLEYKTRVKEGTVVDVAPILGASGASGRKTYKGVVTFIDPQTQGVSETTFRIYADVPNLNHELLPGLKAVVTFHLETGAGAALGANIGAAPGSTLPETPPARQAVPAISSPELPPLPR